jgi:hypothetical protein
MREVVASGNIPALSQLTGNGGFANARLNDALGHVAFGFLGRLRIHSAGVGVLL